MQWFANLFCGVTLLIIVRSYPIDEEIQSAIPQNKLW